MGGHHKKNLRAEKAKVKLKGAKLPKGLNVTKTDFKVRKIEIRTQLKESVLSANNGQRQLNLKEALSRLKHHNLKFRTDALRNVRDAIKAGQAGHLIGHLNELLQGIAAGALDIEQEVRRESFKTLDVVLEGLPVEAVVPFFHIIAAYLRCAMTHVQPSIQEDSLLLLDVLLQRVPSRLLAERSASTIISNFIDMISRTRHDTQHTNRLLTVRLGQGQLTTIKWRTKVLLRLQQILSTLLQQNSQTNSRDSTAGRVVHYDATKVQYYNVLRPQPLDSRDLYSIVGERLRKAENEQLLGYVEQLMPLLHDNWIEVRPQQQQQQLNQLLNVDAAASLHVILDIMAQLWQLVLQYEATQQDNTHELSDWMRRTYAVSFMRIFLQDSNYPYQQMPLAASAQSMSSKKAKKLKTPAAGGELCIAQNLTLVQLVCHFWPQPDDEQSEDYGSLLYYIHQCLRRLDTLSTDEQLRLVAALRALLLDNGAALLQLQAHRMGTVMQTCIDAYVDQQYTTREGISTKVLNLLCQIVQRVDLYQGYGAEEQFAKFLSYLPQLLLKPNVADVTLTAMSTLCRQQNVVFMTALVESASEVFTNLERLLVTGDSCSEESRFENQKRIVNLFYHARNCGDVNQLQATLDQVKNSSESIANYLKSIFSYE
ncbi:PREDICTED: testis-expressed sequence 10 protein homolog [Drosophila arizonae]|uniref:Testis-expressed sequence 10 protein homolog n=1 Tax=Drosophila arizonae TaxID=7263 RepID=A0ABM1PQ70_DROAR|nr:PREDICTED: testis-expressed sequence 10 protein homolog [Drosophila arizonae]